MTDGKDRHLIQRQTTKATGIYSMNNKTLPINEGSKSEKERKEWEEWEKGFREYMATPLADRFASIKDGDIERLQKEMMEREVRAVQRAKERKAKIGEPVSASQ